MYSVHNSNMVKQHLKGLAKAPPGHEQILWVGSKVSLANLQLGSGWFRELLAHMVLQAIALKKPIIDVALWALAALFDHHLWVHELQGAQQVVGIARGKQMSFWGVSKTYGF